MADFVQKSLKSRFETVIWTVKLAFLSIGVISTVHLLTLAIPYFLNFLISVPPIVWNFFCSCLSPPYLYIVLNFIILSIAASSSFHHKLPEVKKKEKVEEENQKQGGGSDTFSSKNTSAADTWLPESDNGSPEKGNSAESSEEIWFNVLSLTDSTPSESSSPADTDTLDATWTAIMEGCRSPVVRQLKKSDTWDTAPPVEPQPVARRLMRKSETFNERSSSSTRMAREPSLTPDELNRQVEAFIHKFRLQRQESYRQYLSMVNRVA